MGNNILFDGADHKLEKNEDQYILTFKRNGGVSAEIFFDGAAYGEGDTCTLLAGKSPQGSLRLTYFHPNFVKHIKDIAGEFYENTLNGERG